MSKLIFSPMRMAAGLLAGIVGKKAFERIWALIDDGEPPKAEDRRIAIPKLALALALEGGLFRVLRGLADHGSRSLFASLTGSWPGEKKPEPSEQDE